MHIYRDSILDAEADPKEIAGQVQRSECPDEAKLSLDEKIKSGVTNIWCTLETPILTAYLLGTIPES